MKDKIERKGQNRYSREHCIQKKKKKKKEETKLEMTFFENERI